MGVELGSRIAIHRPGCVVLKFGRNEASGGLGGTVAADPRLGIAFEFVEGDIDGVAMRLPYPIIAANQRSKGYRFGS